MGFTYIVLPTTSYTTITSTTQTMHGMIVIIPGISAK
jgi:hypothetical protein